MSAIGVVALSSASFFPIAAHAASLKGEGGRPIRIVVPYPPGGPLDVSARAIADAVQPVLGTVVVENRPGVLAQIACVFGEHNVSIARVVQKNARKDQAELVIVTEKVKEKHMKNALGELGGMDSISEISSVIREY